MCLLEELSGERKWGRSLNKRLRSLIQKLGEAIHETVSESEDIAGVVQDIRKQGFEVLLMLEATIGLNEVEQQPVSAQKRLTSGSSESTGDDVGMTGSPGEFTPQDVNFLRSLRIAVESGTGSEAPSE